MRKIVLSITIIIVACLSMQASFTPKLLPWPQQVDWNKETFSLKRVSLSIPPVEDETSQLLTIFLDEYGAVKTNQSAPVIEVRYIDELPEAKVNAEEAYRLKVGKQRITIEATSIKGVYWAIQTLRQLVIKKGDNYIVAGCQITDWPAFRIRGFMQDVGRSYISIDELKKEISTLSQYKINVFHWHLTENQAWRLESKLFPMINDSTNMTRMAGKYYTQEEAKELVNFCKQHNIMLIPEIDMPGHSEAFERAFRHDMQSREGMIILKLLIDELCDVFNDDVPYLHIGTDEVTFTNPRFVPEMVAYVRSKGKKTISWNPGWDYNTGEIDMLQMWSSRGKPHKGIPVIDSRLHYINHYDAFADIVALYNSNTAEQEQGSHDYAGAIIALWHDRIVQPETNIVLQNGLYPAALTLAERTWRGGGKDYFYTKGCMIAPEGSDEYNTFSEFEERMLWHKEHNLKELPFAYVRQSNVKWRITDAFPNNGDLQLSFPPEQELNEKYLYEGKEYGSKEVIGAGIYLRHVWGNIIPAFYKDPQPNHTAYAWTWVYSPKKQQVGLWASTQNYSRSEKDLPPRQGTWDYKGSRLWLNDAEIQPPVWASTHTELSNEILLSNENFEVRQPIPVTLQKGWNKVLLKLPIGTFTSPEVRLQKWMFTFVFVTPDGKKEVENIIYSPDKKH